MSEQELLETVYEKALELHREGQLYPALPSPYNEYSKTIVDYQDRRKGALAVLVTLLLKKLHTPEQDIRMHQARLQGGFSGRGLDTQVVTPFLKSRHFPAPTESGWLTRAFEQSHPYDLEYPGNISPAVLKTAFLRLVDGIQSQEIPVEDLLVYIMLGLVQFRDRNTNIVLSRPVNLSVAEVIDRVRRHHSVQMEGASRLPVLAIHAILNILGRETDRYRDCTVLPLEHHNAADQRTDLIGDAHIITSNNELFEGYEIKHNIPITSELIQTSFEKLRTTTVKRFYILTTHVREDYSEFEPDIQQVARAHGCQLILNGVDRTLTYYLRLIEDTTSFVNEYVTNLETDPSIPFQLKQAWNEIVGS